MIALAIMSNNWIIGEDHHPAFKIDQDREHFHNLTNGKVVVYGSHTLQTLPNQHILKDRTNIILSHRHDFSAPGATIATSINELQFILRNYEPNDVFLIGGATLFHELIDQCSSAILTVVNQELPNKAESEYFPNLTQRPNWFSGHISSTHYYNGYQFSFRQYTNTDFRKHTGVTSLKV